MIRSFEIRNFKAFKDVTLRLGQFVLLSGVNSSGKSSVLQALRLAELAATHGPTVQLNNLMGLELGEATDVLNWEALVQHIDLAVHTDGGSDRFRLAAPDDQGRSVILEVQQPEPDTRKSGLENRHLPDRRARRPPRSPGGRSQRCKSRGCWCPGRVYGAHARSIQPPPCVGLVASSLNCRWLIDANAGIAIRGMALLYRASDQSPIDVVPASRCRCTPVP